MNSAPQEFPIRVENDIVMARKVVRDTATALGFGITDVTRIVTAASELTRNIYQYAGSGVMRLRILQGNPMGLELIFQDNGPGIPDIDQAMQMGFTTGKGMGLGLPGARRLMDELKVQSEIGKGTTIEAKKWCR